MLYEMSMAGLCSQMNSKKSQLKEFYLIFIVLGILIIITSAVKIIAIKPVTEPLSFSINDEEINVTVYIDKDSKIKNLPYKNLLKTENKWGYNFSEIELEDEEKKIGKKFDKKIYYQLDTSEDYIKRAENPYRIERHLPKQKGILGVIPVQLIDFSEPLSKENNAYNVTISEQNVTICDNENCTLTHLELQNVTIKEKRDISLSLYQQVTSWIAEYFNIFDTDPELINTGEANFSSWTLHQTNLTNSGVGANITLNYTILTGDMSGGIKQYNTTGNATSPAHDTLSTTSKIDRMNWTVNLPNSSCIIGHTIDGPNDDTFGFTCNGSVINDLSTAVLTAQIDFVMAGSYTLPTRWNYRDIVGFALDDTANNILFAFFINGSTASGTFNPSTSTSLTAIGRYTLPAGYNVSNIIGFAMRAPFPETAVFFNNCTTNCIYLQVGTVSSPFSFSTSNTITVPSGISIKNALGSVFTRGSNDFAVFLPNSSHIVDASVTTFTQQIDLVNPTLDTYPANINITTRTNISMQARVSNDSIDWEEWQTFRNDNDGSYFTQNATINRIARYVQCRGVFSTPDYYVTPSLSYCAINYTEGTAEAPAEGDTTKPIANTSFNISLSSMFIGMTLNFSANMTDNINLTNATFIENMTGIKTFFNFSINGTGNGLNTYIRNATYTLCTSPCVANFSVVATDNSSNSRLNDTIVSITTAPAGDTTKPIINTSFNISSPLINDIINFTANATDETQLLFINWTYNLSTGLVKLNYSVSGTVVTISNSTQLCSSACVVNFTAYATDTSNNVKQNSTLLTVIEADDFAAWNNQTLISILNNFSVDWVNASIRLNLVKDKPNFNFSDFNPDGSDVRIVDNATKSNITSFVEKWNKSENTAIVWFNISIPSKTNKSVLMYFNNSNAPPRNEYPFMAFENFTSGNTPSGWQKAGVAGFNNITNPFTPPYNAYFTSGVDGNNFNPILPPQTNYTVDYYFYAVDALLDNGYWSDGNDGSPFRWETSTSSYPQISFTCKNSSNDVVAVKETATWWRAVIMRDRSNNNATVRFYRNSTDELWNQCTGILAGFGTSQIRTDWAFTGGTAGAGTLRIDNFKMYKNFGFNMSDPIITFDGAKAEIIAEVLDTTAPIINGTLNISIGSIFNGMVINATFNATDNINLTNITIITNHSAIKEFYNFSINGTGNGLGTYQRSQNFTLCSNCVVNITGIAIDNSSNKKQNETIFSVITAPAGDTTFPLINFTLNITPPRIDDVVNISANISDETALLSGNITVNLSTGKVFFNYSLSSTFAFISNTTDLRGLIVGEVINYTIYATDTSNNVKQNSTVVTISDNIKPIINGTLNKSISILQSDIINATFNATDETALHTGQVIVNDTGAKRFFNFTLSGTSAQFSQNFTVACASGCVVNVTGLVNDTTGNIKQNETVFSVASATDTTPPVVNTTFNTTSPVIGTVLNFTGNFTDETGLLFANWTFNSSGFVTKLNYSISGTSGQISNITTLTRVDVVNFTLFVTDTSNNVKQNSTLLIVADATFPIINGSLNKSITSINIKDVLNITFNLTDETGLLFGNITWNLTTGKTFINFSLSGTSAQISNVTALPSTCIGGCTINVTGYATDTSNNVRQNSTIFTVIDNTPPIVNTTFNNSNILITDTINYTANITDETQLKFANFSVNLSTGKVFANYSISGTSIQLFNTTTLRESCSAQETCVLNFTWYATDTSSNVYQNSTLLEIADIITPIVNTTLNISNAFIYNVINYTANITDGNGLISANWTVNLSTGKVYNNFTLSGNSAQVSNKTLIDVVGVYNFTIYATDVKNNVRQNSTLLNVLDNIPPIVNTTFNTTTLRNIDIINFTGNITDETSLSTANWTINFSTGKIFMNYSLSGTSVQVSNTTNLYGLQGGTVLNFTLYATDTSSNTRQNSTTFTITDALVPIVNTSFNISNPFINDIINFTANATDETQLLFINWTYNLSTGKVYLNYSMSGTSVTISNSTQLCPSACVVNFTAYATDTSNNIRQNSTIFTVIDNIFPIVNTTFNITNALVDSVVNYSANITDETGLLFANLTYNISGILTKINYSISGTSLQISNFTTITDCTETCVLNFTWFATDTSNNIKQNSTLLVVADVTAPIVNATTNISSPNLYEIINITANITDGNGLLSANITYNLSGILTKVNFTISGASAQVSNATRLDNAGVVNFTVYATDINNNIKQNSTLIMVIDNIAPIINGSINATTININDVINVTFNLTDETGLSYANITWNLTSGTTKINFTGLSGTSIQISNVTRLPDSCVGGCVINVTGYATDTSNNIRQNSTIFIVTDNVFPIVNASFNISMSNIKINDILNFSCNITDETGLLFGNLTNNQSGILIKSNYSLSGTRAEIINTTNITSSRGSVINFTCYGTDTSNNVKQNSTLITIADTLGSIFIGLNGTSVNTLINSVLNISGNITDADGNIEFGWIASNISKDINYTFIGSGSNFNFSQNITINLTRGSIINFTVYYNDSYGTTIQNSTLLEINNTNITISAFQPLNLIPQFNFTSNITFNITITDPDSDTITLIWEVNGTFNISNQNISYIFNKVGIFNITGNVTDGFSTARQEWIVKIINDTVEFVPPSEEPQPIGGGIGGDGGAVPSLTEQRKQVQEQLLTYGCPESETFLNRLTSKCKIPDNLVCEDGENFILDNDCKVNINNLKAGDLFKSMWFLRFVLFFSIFLLARDSKRYPLIIIMLIILFVYNGAFIRPGAEYDQMACMDINFLINTGYCIMPEKPILGWLIAFTMVITLISYFVEAGQAKQAKKTQQKKGRKPSAEQKQSSPETSIVAFILVSALVYAWMLANGGIIIFNSPECTDVGFFINFGECVTPTRPIVGWVMGFTLILLALGYFIRKTRKTKEKPTDKPKTI